MEGEEEKRPFVLHRTMVMRFTMKHCMLFVGTKIRQTFSDARRSCLTGFGKREKRGGGGGGEGGRRRRREGGKVYFVSS